MVYLALSGAILLGLTVHLARSQTATNADDVRRGHATFFAEVNVMTDIGGPNSSSKVTLLPGARWLVVKDFWLAAGYEVPLTPARELDGRVWISIYRDF
ncbi:MAG: hypothetical protein K2Z80_06760 [Xanthobacteraceae bacterium]|nr:hypothetical protein [Xanthobacteraceae bacterium]